jgi:hypothetical protein
VGKRRTEEEWEQHIFDTERDLQNYIVKRLNLLIKEGKPIWYVKVADRYTSGIPDLLLSVGGKFLAVELKRNTKGRLTKLQAESLRRINESGGVAIVAFTWGEVKHAIEGLLE